MNINMTSSGNIDFGDLTTLWLKQELFMASRLLAKATYYTGDERVQALMSEFIVVPILPTGQMFYMDDVLARISEIFKKFENIGLIYDLDYGEAQFQHTTMYFKLNSNKMRSYKVELMKELRMRDSDNKIQPGDKDLLVNGELEYDVNNREVRYAGNSPLGLDSSSDYGRLLILLMNNVGQRVSYTQICDSIGRDYKLENVDPETDSSIRREIQQIKKDLLLRLSKAGVPEQILNDLIVSRDGYKMNKLE